MPNLSDVLKNSLNNYKSVDITPSPQASLSAAPELQPVSNPMIRCPLPPIYTVNPDNLRQFYAGGQVPQYRILSQLPQGNNSGTSGSSDVASGGSSSGGGGGGGGGGGTPSLPASQQTSITSGVLAPNQTFVTTLNIAKMFGLLRASVNASARIQLYGTSAAQAGDASRPLDISPPAGTAQGIICDLALDTLPLAWSFQDRVGANADNPQTGLVYLTLTNLTTGNTTITLTLVYVPLES